MIFVGRFVNMLEEYFRPARLIPKSHMEIILPKKICFYLTKKNIIPRKGRAYKHKAPYIEVA